MGPTADADRRRRGFSVRHSLGEEDFEERRRARRRRRQVSSPTVVARVRARRSRTDVKLGHRREEVLVRCGDVRRSFLKVKWTIY